MNKKEILQQNYEHRLQEIENYQINIDNYTMALEEIELNHKNELGMEQFKEQITSLLISEKIEQRKALVMRNVLLKQIGDL